MWNPSKKQGENELRHLARSVGLWFVRAAVTGYTPAVCPSSRGLSDRSSTGPTPLSAVLHRAVFRQIALSLSLLPPDKSPVRRAPPLCNKSRLSHSTSQCFARFPASASQVTLTPFCVGSKTVSVPIIAPMAAPPELGEELCLRVGFVGSGAAARIEAAEVRMRADRRF